MADVDLSRLEGERITVFEGTPGGVLAVQAVLDLFAALGMS